MFLRVRDGKINDIRFTTDGCVFTIAASSVATEMAKGKTFAQCIKINQSTILEKIGKVPDDHEHCAYLAALTFHRAMRDYVATGKKS